MSSNFTTPPKGRSTLIGYVMVGVYLLLGLSLLLAEPLNIWQGQQPTQRLIIGGLLFVYGLFRLWRLRKEQRQDPS